MSAIDNLKAVLLDPEGNVSIQGSEEDKRIIQKALTEIEKPIVETPDVQRLIGEVVKLQAALAKTDEENTKLKVIEAYWRDYKKVVKAFGFPDAYPGGINRWIQDKLAENKQLKKTLYYELPDKYPDNCEICKGANCGVRGNENIINGVVMCDYCHVATDPSLSGGQK